MHYETLLVEIGTEELPPKSLKALSDAFTEQLTQQLREQDVAFGEVKSFATPRRFAVQLLAVASQQPDKVVEKRGPAIAMAFDDNGQPTKAAEGWARGNGIRVEDAERLVTDKGEWLLYKASVKGQSLADLLPSMVSNALKKLPIPKPMRWGAGSDQFIRPVKTVTLMYGSDVIPAEIMGVSSNRQLLGHRFHAPQGVSLANANDYEAALESAWVIADFDKRRQRIVDGIAATAKQLGGKVVEDADLVDEVTALVEWPVVLSATFDAEFLSVPKEPLIVTMKDDQRYFPLVNEHNELLPAFVFVTNIESKEPQLVIAGNEKVVRPRLADAQFFFESDKKVPLAERVEALGNVLFQQQLGSIKDKSDRIATVAAAIASLLNGQAAIAQRAGYLCKADLISQMVQEFPETQGVMGMHYATHDQEPEGVATAIYEHYLPRFAGDELPQTVEGAAVAIADKLDTLVGIFGIGQTPKGDRDPFALRRAAIGLLRIMVEQGYSLDLSELVQLSQNSFGNILTVPAEQLHTEVVDFLLGRFRSWYQEQGIAVDVIQAVLARRPTNPVDFDQRIKAVTAFRELPAAEALAAANKRVGNILAKVKGDIPTALNEALFQEEQEVALAQVVQQAQTTTAEALNQGDYTQALTALAQLQEPVDAFFDHVLVNAEDEAVRENRLALLHMLRELFLQIADISVLN